MKIANNILLCLAGAFLSGFILIKTDNTTTRQVQDEAWHMLINDFGLVEENIEVEVVRLINVDNLPAGRLKISFPTNHRLPKGRVQIQIFVDDKKTNAWGILFIKHYNWVMVATHTLSRDDELNLDDVQAVRMDITRDRAPALTESQFHNAVIEQKTYLKRVVPEGQPLRQSDLRPALAADTGFTIRVLYRRNGVAITLACKARQPGIVGDAIRVYNPISKTHYQVLLTGAGEGTWIKSY